MKNETPIKIVCFFARERGVCVLERLLHDQRFEIVGLVTHKKEPSTEDPERKERAEYSKFLDLAVKNQLPLHVVDTLEESQRLDFMKEIGDFDFLISVSWRFLIPEEVFSRAKIQALNIHRGKLPQYAGAYPIQQALENGEKEIILTVHRMSAQIDAGEVLLEKVFIPDLDNELGIDKNIDRIKEEMLPMYPEAILEAIDLVLKEKTKWVFFDLDGTLADSFEVMYEVYLDFLKDFNITGNAEEFEELNGPSLTEIIKVLKSRYSLDEDEAALLTQYEKKILRVYESTVKPIDGSGLVLSELKKRNYKLMLTTSSGKNIASQFVERHGWGDHFDGYVFGNEVKYAKPDPDIYHLALQKANVSFDDVVVVEDSLNGVRSAKGAGVYVAGLTSNQTKEALLGAGSDVTISKLDEVFSILEGAR